MAGNGSRLGSHHGLTVEELAKQGKKRNRGRSIIGLPAIPICVVISFLIALALIAVCTPMGVIFVSNSKEVVGDLSDQVMHDAVQMVHKGVVALNFQASALTEVISKSLLVRRVITTQFDNLDQQPEMANLFQSLLVPNQDITNLVCLSYHNLSGKVPSDWWDTHDYPNMTALMVSAPVNGTERPFTDYAVV
ncbi:hypothetical protein HK104_009324 [Borealophlyctis nickersoniae]|nr:hypothetical protein HK104_009324 [Borealophlyctis nickersoniae]